MKASSTNIQAPEKIQAPMTRHMSIVDNVLRNMQPHLAFEVWFFSRAWSLVPGACDVAV